MDEGDGQNQGQQQQQAAESYTYGSQYYGYGYWQRSNGSGSQKQQQQAQQYQYKDEGYSYGNQNYGYGYNNGGGRKLLQGYKKVNCDMCEEFRCFDGLEEWTEDQLMAYQQEQYNAWVAENYPDNYYQGQDAEANGEEQAAEEEDQAAEEEQDDGQRRRRRMDEGDADAEEDNQYEVDMDAILAWVESRTGCQATDGLLDEQWPLYSGFMCNQDGSGVDIGLFLDEDCSIYTTKESFARVASEYDLAYMYEASTMITYPFLNDISCNGELQYLSMQEWSQMQQNYQYNEDNANQEYGDSSEFCQALFEGGDAGAPLSLHDCNQDGQEDEEDEEAEVEYYNYDYYWYQYVLSYADSSDMQATCEVVRTMQGEYTPVYSWKQSGQIYNYGSGPMNRWDTTNVRNFFAEYADKMDGWLIFAIVLGVLFAVTSFFCVLNNLCSSRNKCSSLKGGEDPVMAEKRRELIDKNGSLL